MKYCFLILCFLFHSCNQNEAKSKIVKPLTDVNYISDLFGLKVKPIKVLYTIKTKQITNDRADIGLNEIPNKIKFLVCVLEYSDKDIITVKNQVIQSNYIREIDFIHSNEIYEDWLPIDIKKRFKQIDNQNNIVVMNPIFTLNKYFSYSIQSSSLNYNGFCFIEKNYVYIYKVF